MSSQQRPPLVFLPTSILRLSYLLALIALYQRLRLQLIHKMNEAR